MEGDGELWVKGKVAWDSPEPEFDSEGNVINPEKPEFESSTIFFPLLNHNRLNMTHPKGYY